jgi:hypothetical protein
MLVLFEARLDGVRVSEDDLRRRDRDEHIRELPSRRERFTVVGECAAGPAADPQAWNAVISASMR